MDKVIDHQTGFTLLESLIAILILSIGILSISHITAEALNEIAENEARSMALYAATKELEPLYIAADQGMLAFKAALDKYDVDNNNVYNDITVTQTNSHHDYTLLITAGQDSSPTPINILTDNQPEIWNTPLKIGVKVIFIGKNKIKTAQAPFVFIIS